MSKTRIAVLTGGISSEREVALRSAANVAQILSDAYDVATYDFPVDIDRFLAERKNVDVAIPVFHGKGGEDGTVQGFLKTLDIPFIFSDVEAHAVAMNKSVTKDVVRRTGVQMAEGRLLHVSDRLAAVFLGPCVLKLVDSGSSIGVTIARTAEEFEKGLDAAFACSSAVLVEDFVEGDEYTVAVIEEEGQVVALPVIAIRPKTAFFDYESKYSDALVDEICPAPIPDELRDRLQDAAVKVHLCIGARHLTRSDFIVDKNGGIWFLEINTIPGQTAQSLVPKAIRASGRDVGRVFGGWVEGMKRGSPPSP